jgi:pimeloyl-ACP methyl ester carboxylesterase
MASDEITPFRIAVPDEAIHDLKRRLGDTRWPETEAVDDWSQGTPLAYVKEVCDTWANAYDWRDLEARLNAYPQLTTEIDGLAIHAIHVQSPVANARPLVITHGWPGSVVEFLKVIGPLSDPAAHGGDPADAFHVVAPSLPGYGWSGKPDRHGWGVERIADAWGVLMRRLGYDRYLAQGGDWGAAVTTMIGARDPEGCRAIHVNMPIGGPGHDDFADLTPREQDALAGMKHYQDWDSGYSKEQSTRPQTVGYSLVDSPAGLAAWIIEKFWAWTDCDGHPENALTRQEMLDDVSVYWFTASGASSGRLYWESFGRFREPPVVKVPAAMSIFPKEIFRPSQKWAARTYADIRYWNELNRGGHFAAWEQPALFVDEVRAAFREMPA